MTTSTEPPSSNKTRNFFDRLTSVFHEEEVTDRAGLLETIREARVANILDDETLSMIEGALEVSEIRADDLMVPRAQIHAVDLSEPREVWLKALIASGHSRFPAVEGDLDNILGILHAKDLLQILIDPSVDPRKIIRPARYIPETQPINVLLRDFKATRNHMALVIDEFGSMSGLITIEDVLEQIVGDIADEFDHDENVHNIQVDSPGKWRVRAITPIEQFNEFFSCDLEDMYCDTIGGLVTDRFEHVPLQGETIVEKGFRFRILKADERQVRLLGVEKLD